MGASVLNSCMTVKARAARCSIVNCERGSLPGQGREAAAAVTFSLHTSARPWGGSARGRWDSLPTASEAERNGWSRCLEYRWSGGRRDGSMAGGCAADMRMRDPLVGKAARVQRAGRLPPHLGNSWQGLAVSG